MIVNLSFWDGAELVKYCLGFCIRLSAGLR